MLYVQFCINYVLKAKSFFLLWGYSFQVTHAQTLCDSAFNPRSQVVACTSLFQNHCDYPYRVDRFLKTFTASEWEFQWRNFFLATVGMVEAESHRSDHFRTQA
jgi:hypothetical protein